MSPHPAPVTALIHKHRVDLDRDTDLALHGDYAISEQIKADAATYTGAQPGQIALTGDTTTGVGLMYGGLTLRPDDEILTTTHDFIVTVASRLAARTGAKVIRIELYDDPVTASVEQIVGRIRDAITAVLDKSDAPII